MLRLSKSCGSLCIIKLDKSKRLSQGDSEQINFTQRLFCFFGGMQGKNLAWSGSRKRGQADKEKERW